jgi:hypothetical protein
MAGGVVRVLALVRRAAARPARGGLVRAIRPSGQLSYPGVCGPWGMHSIAELQRPGPWAATQLQLGDDRGRT